MNRHRAGRWLLFSLPLLFLAAFYFLPLARILQVALAPDGTFDGVSSAGILTQSFVWRVLWFTTWQAAASTALTLLLGLPLAYVFAHYRFPGKTVLRALMTIPFVLPTVVVASAFATLVGHNGVVNRTLQAALGLERGPVDIERTVWIILLAHAFYNTSVIVRTVGGFWSHLNPHLDEAAAVLGAGRWRRLREVTLPLLAPSVLAGSLLVFLFCFTSFGVVLILGGLQFATLEVEIYRQAVSLFNLPAAAVLALLQLGITFAVMVVYTRLQARLGRPLELRPQGDVAREAGTRRERLLVVASVVAITLLLLSPLIALAWRSLTVGGAGPSLDAYRALTADPQQSAFFAPPWAAVGNSLRFALATVVISVSLGLISAVMIARRRGVASAVLDPVLLLPLGTSAVTLGLGYIVALGPLRTSLMLVPLAHALIAMPFVVRTLLPALRRLDPRLGEAASVLGAGPVRSWREVALPLIWPALVVGAVFAFTISMGEFGATLLVGRPDTPTMPVVIYRALGRPGQISLGQALAMSTLLMLVCGAGMVLIERLRVRDLGEF